MSDMILNQVQKYKESCRCVLKLYGFVLLQFWINNRLFFYSIPLP